MCKGLHLKITMPINSERLIITTHSIKDSEKLLGLETDGAFLNKLDVGISELPARILI